MLAGPEDGGLGGRIMLWGAAGILVLALHGGMIAAVLARAPVPRAPAQAPAAVMIDLAPIPAAPPAPQTQLNPDPAPVPEVDTMAPEPASLVPPPPIVPPEPLEATDPPTVADLPDPTPAPIADIPPPPDALPDLPEPEVAQPRPRTGAVEKPKPEPAQPKRSETKPVEKRAAEAPPAAAPSQIKAATTGAPAAPETTNGNRSLSPATWQARLMAHLERMKRYPPGARKRHEEGTAHVRFALDAEGNVQNVRLVRSSGFGELDAAVLDLVKRASPVPAPPPGVPREITAPVRFDVR